MIYRVIMKGTGKKRHKVALPVRNREELMALRNSPENLAHLAAAQQGNQKEKAQLVQLAYNLGHVDGVLAGCKSIGSFFFHDVDWYGSEELRVKSEELKKLILEKKEEIGLMMLERSASGGWHLVCKRVPGTTILENQVRVATALQIEMDTSAKDLQRVVFSTSGSDDDLPFLDDSLFTEPMTAEECEAEYKRLRERQQRGEELVPAGAKKANKHYRPWEEMSDVGGLMADVGCKMDDVGCKKEEGRSKKEEAKPQTSDISHQTSNFSPQPSSISPRTRFIARGVMKEKELLDSDFTNEGGRHTTVKIFLGGATQLLTKDEVNGVLAELMPDHWNDDNIQQLVNDFYKNYTKPSQRLLKFQEQLFTQSQRMSDGRGATDDADAPAPTPPEMPKTLPKLIALLTSKTPDIYKAAVAHAVFPPLATHLCGVRFCYTDNVEHEATLMNCLMAGTGSGKGCIDEPIRHIMADIKWRDEQNLRREAEWKKDCQKKGANKDRQARPEGLVIQIIDPDMTKPALVTRMDEAEGHFVYVKLNELDLFEQLKGQTGKQHFQLMCLAFDPGAEYGQTRIGTQSVTARPVCRFNWNACTTILKGRRFFSRVLTDGPLSRINFCTIPEAEIGTEQPVYGRYDSAFSEALRPYVDNLTTARGLIACPQAIQLAKKLQEECAEFARLSQSEVYWNLSHRACVIAWLKACVLYVANGQKWEKPIEDFIRWSLNYDLWCKMQFFGADIEKAEQGDASRTGSRGPRNLLELLPDEFTLDDARRVRQQQGLSTDRHRCLGMIRQWVYRKYVLQITDYSFKKSK